MVKSKKNDNNDEGSSENTKDLTRIEDLSEFLHQEDTDLDSKFDGFAPDAPSDLSTTGISLDVLDEEDEELETAVQLEDEAPPEIPMEEALEDSPFGESSEPTEINFGEPELESSFSFDTNEEIVEETPEETQEETSYFEEVEPEPVKEIYTHTSEKFEDVKAFAQNFSYGKTSGGGNPPYSIIVRHIKYEDDANDIVELLKEFGMVTTATEKDTLRAIELGSLIIPQISEYCAIVLAHKLRRYDLDLEVGLSDEIHPSKSGESNPKGLLKKNNLKQNKSESVKLTDIDTGIQDIIVSTTSAIPGYYVESYIGVQTTFTIVEEAELEKLQYVQKSHREQGEIFDYDNTEGSDLTTEKAFKDYQNSFALLYEDLAMQLKQKAFTQNANALLGLNFQLSPLQFERSHLRVNAYQITCSATLAVLNKENV